LKSLVVEMATTENITGPYQVKNRFKHYIGIDYSGANTPTSRLKGLQVFMASQYKEPVHVWPYDDKNWNWTRKEIALWCVETINSKHPVIIGLDHGFSFPLSYMNQYQLNSWDEFLDDFCEHWPTDQDHTFVDQIRNSVNRTGDPKELRLCEKYTSSTQSVFKLDGRGAVGKSTHTGIPWLRFIRRHPRIMGKVHFWPFDGFDIPEDQTVIVEVYPSIFRRRYKRVFKSPDEHDAYSIARWFQENEGQDTLGYYFKPPLPDSLIEQVMLEGWILGIC
jgi:hypothetical protein